METGTQFQQLIELLSEANNYQSKQEQLAAIERRLVEAELNPSCYDFDNLKESLDYLRSLAKEFEGRKWQPLSEELEVYF